MTTQALLRSIDDLVDAAIESELDVIYCGFTGYPIGKIDRNELRTCVKGEVTRDPFQSQDAILEHLAMQQFIYSSRPSPSLSYHKDRDTFLRMLLGSTAGPARLFTHLLGRLLFESLLRRKSEIETSVVRRQRIEFQIDCYSKVAGLPDHWHQSLGAYDELTSGASDAVALLKRVSGDNPSEEDEAKAAQAALETLLRLDAIHGLRNKFYGDKLLNEVRAYGESLNWTFTALAATLQKVEEDAIVRLTRHISTPVHNQFVLSSTRESIRWSRDRLLAAQAEIERGIDAEQVLNRFAGSGKEVLRKAQETLDSYGTGRVIQGKQNAKAKREARRKSFVAEVQKKARQYVDSGQPIPAELKASLDSIARVEKNKGRKKRSSKRVTPQQAAALNDAIEGVGLAGLFGEEE